jgi:hypothetical protein
VPPSRRHHSDERVNGEFMIGRNTKHCCFGERNGRAAWPSLQSTIHKTRISKLMTDGGYTWCQPTRPKVAVHLESQLSSSSIRSKASRSSSTPAKQWFCIDGCQRRFGMGSSAEPKRPTLPYRVLRPWHLSMFSWENFICFFVPANYPMSHSNPSTIKLFSWIKSITNLFSSQCSINFYMCIKPFTLNILAKRNLQYIYILMRTRWWDFILFQFCR